MVWIGGYMSLNLFLNIEKSLDSKVRKIVDRVYPDIAHVDVASVNRSVQTLGREILVYEGNGAGKKEKLVWGINRMACRRVVIE